MSSTLANGVPWLIGTASTPGQPMSPSSASQSASGRPQTGGAAWPRTRVTARSTHWLAAKPSPAMSPIRSSSLPPGASAACRRSSTLRCAAGST